MRSRRILFAAPALITLACAGNPASEVRAPTESANVPVERLEIADEDFARLAKEILRDGSANTRRLSILVAIVNTQLKRAQAYFEAGHIDEGLRAVSGALYLVRAGEFRKEMLEGTAASLQSAANAVAQGGHEGRAQALYTMLELAAQDPAVRRDAAEHLEAIKQWQSETVGRAKRSLQAAGAAQRVATGRALYDSTPGALQAARDATVEWINRARVFNAEQRMPRNNFERDEWIEAHRAITTGALTLVAISVRHGDAAGAFALLESADVSPVVVPSLYERVGAASEDDDPASWAELFGLFEAASGEQGESGIPAHLAEAAAFGAAIQLYRSEPNTLRAAIPLARFALRHNLSEVAPLLFVDALGDQPEAGELSWVLGFVFQAIVRAEAVGDLAAARRVFTHAKPLIELGASPEYLGKVKPSAATLHQTMGAIETRAGELTRARQHVLRATKPEATPETLRLLAAIDRQRGDFTSALESLKRVVALTSQANDIASEAEAQLNLFDVYRETNDISSAKQALSSALERALDARRLARSRAEQANAERILARVLEQYGERDAARRATERAFEASENNVRQLTATMLDTLRRALTLGDLRSARNAVRRGVEADLADEDVVYAALWLKLLEKRLQVPSDGTTEEAFASVEARHGWSATLRAWGRGRLTDAQLLQRARNRVERVEALFYSAMAARTQDETSAAREKLREVARSEAIELVEVAIARDLLAARIDVELPDGVSVP